MGCFKALGTTAVPGSFPGPDVSQGPALPHGRWDVGPARPDAALRLEAAVQGDHRGQQRGQRPRLRLRQPATDQASNGSASYYAWDPPQTPGVRFIAIDTNSEGGILGPFGPQPSGSSNGNLDHPQFIWLRNELNKAENRGKLVVIFGHHPVRTMDSVVPDEATGECTGTQHSHGDTPEHDTNPGCDPDPRDSEPLHLGDPEQASAAGSNAFTFTQLMANHPNVIAYVAGHTHEHALLPCGSTRTTGPGDRRFCGDHLWWEINTRRWRTGPTSIA